MGRRVVVTGMGAVSPIGNNVLDMWNSAKNGVNGIDTIKSFDLEDMRVTLAGELKNIDFGELLGKKQSKRMDRSTQVGMVASREAVKDANIDFSFYDPYKTGVIIGSGIGGLDTIAVQIEKALDKGFNRMSPFFIPMSLINIISGHIAIDNQVHGMCTSPVTACASGTNAIGDAFHAIKHGTLDCCITGGSEASVIRTGVCGFDVMNALSRSTDRNTASVPFDLNRTGFVMGEGSGILILEELEGALKRGARIYAEIIGYGATCDASHITAPMPGGIAAAKCMEMAIAEAGLKYTDVDYINAHGTSTPLNDKTETAAIKAAFKEHAYKLNVSSTKSMTGHLLGASGGVEAILSVKALNEDFIPPTINYTNKDPECDLCYTPNKGVKKVVNVVMSNSLGFGGHNASILFRKYGE